MIFHPFFPSVSLIFDTIFLVIKIISKYLLLENKKIQVIKEKSNTYEN